MTVQSLCQQMTQKELCHWMSYYKIKNDEEKGTSGTQATNEGKSNVDDPATCARVFGFLKHLSKNGNLPPTPRSKKKD